MAQFYTLEEAARVLGMGPEELKTKAQQREVRAFMDGNSWRFRVADVDELARRRGLGSDPDLSLSDLDLVARAEDPASASAISPGSDFEISEFDSRFDHEVDASGDASGSSTAPAPRPILDSESDRDILLDDLNLPPGPLTGTSSTIIGLERDKAGKSDLIPAPRPGSMSDVRPVPLGEPVSPSDSDVSLSPKGAPSASDVSPARPQAETQALPRPSDSDVTLFHEEEDEPSPTRPPSSRQTAAHHPPAAGAPGAPHPLGSSGEVRASGGVEDESDFELNPSGSTDLLHPVDTGSDFELTALESSDEFDVTPQAKAQPKPGDSDVTGFLPSASGINLARPSDSGINLQSGVNLEPGFSGLGPGASSSAIERARQQALSGTSLPTPAEKNLFDDTDFEVDASATGAENRTVQLDAASDFDLDEGDSDRPSEVFAIDEDDVDVNAATTLAAAPSRSGPGGAGSSSGARVADWAEDETAAAAALRPRPGSRKVEDASVVADEGAPAPALRVTPAGPAPEWGGLWVGLLGVTTILLVLLSFVAMDLALNLRANREASSSFGLVKQFAGIMGETPK